MRFKESIRFKYGTLNRGDACLVNSIEAVYLGSYADSMWVHLFLVENWDGSDTIIQIVDLGKVTTSNNKAPELEGQMTLV